MTATARRGEASLIWIGGYKFLQGLLLVVVATGILKTVNGDLQNTLLQWVKTLHLDADNRYIASLL